MRREMIVFLLGLFAGMALAGGGWAMHVRSLKANAKVYSVARALERAKTKKPELAKDLAKLARPVETEKTGK